MNIHKRQFDEISQCIYALRLPLSIAIVVFHSLSINGKQLFGPSFQLSDYSILANMSSINDAFLADMIVPIFFWISGYLFYNWENPLSLLKISKIDQNELIMLSKYRNLDENGKVIIQTLLDLEMKRSLGIKISKK